MAIRVIHNLQPETTAAFGDQKLQTQDLQLYILQSKQQVALIDSYSGSVSIDNGPRIHCDPIGCHAIDF